MRIGTKKKPFYRVVVVDERSKRTGGFIELLGTYNPLTEPKDIKLKQDRIDYWVKQGAQMSTGYLRIIGKAPQRPPRKPKKESKQVTGDSGQPKTKEVETEIKEEPIKEAETVQKDSENSNKSEDQNVSESENLKEEASETPISSDNSDQSGTQSSSESSEKTTPKNEKEVVNEGSA